MVKEGTNNLVLLFFSWWYGFLPHRLYLASKASIISIVDLFSVKLIFSTLFAPWRRDIVSYENLSLQEKFSVMMLNIASRFIGFLVKISVLGAFLVTFLVVIIITVGAYAIWLAFPLTIIALIIIGFVNIISVNY
jgi:hypothetical protein